MAARKFSLNFGLVNIPVGISKATREQKVKFNQITPEHEHDGKKCGGTRVKQFLRCEKCKTEMDKSALKKGYEYDKGMYAVFERGEVDAVKLRSTKVIEIVGFVGENSVDPVIYAEAYYVEPLEGGDKSYALLRDVLAEVKQIAIGRLTMSGREHPVAIGSRKGLLFLNLLWYPAEIVKPLALENVEISDREMELGKQLVTAMHGADVSVLSDRYIEAMEKLIKARREGKEIPVVADNLEAETTVDISKALQDSLKLRKKAVAVEAK